MIKIQQTYPFWTWLMRLSYRKIKKAIPRLGVGVPHMRDPDAKCEWYAPRKRVPGDGPAECETDGHYLCGECIFNEKKQK